MAQAVEVMFKGRRLEYFVNPDNIPFSTGDFVIVEAERGIDMGRVAHLGVEVEPPDRDRAFRSVLRRAREADFKTQNRIRAEEQEAIRICRERIQRLRLDMKLVDAESQIDGHRMTFYFTAEQRVDFRELVKDLASIFKTRIELRQIGARDAAKRLGGVGPCGREYCCSTWLKAFSPVTLKMAKGQGLALAPSKISGGCGRLMCCLMYEDHFYKEMSRVFPKVGTRFEIDGTPLVLVSNDLFREVVKLRDEEGDQYEWPLDEFPVPSESWGGMVRPRGADARGGEGSGCGKADPKPTGMIQARGNRRSGNGAAGAPFMRGGRGRRTPDEPVAETPPPPPAEMIRHKAQRRRRDDRETIGSGAPLDRADLPDSELVAAADPVSTNDPVPAKDPPERDRTVTDRAAKDPAGEDRAGRDPAGSQVSSTEAGSDGEDAGGSRRRRRRRRRRRGGNRSGNDSPPEAPSS